MYRYVPLDAIRQLLPLLDLPGGAFRLGYILNSDGSVNVAADYPPATQLPRIDKVVTVNITATAITLKACRQFTDPSLSRDLRAMLEGVQ